MAPPVRYDPIWRRIKLDEIASQLDGKFPDQNQRLEQLNNWGALSWLHEHATASKLQHHHGVTHTSRQFLEADAARARHAVHFRVAAHVMHWGHLPLSYQGEEALLRAAHVDPQVRAELVV